MVESRKCHRTSVLSCSVRLRFVLLAGIALAVETVGAQWPPEERLGPTATLAAAPAIQLTGEVDSNSPVIRDLIGGRPTTVVMTSFAGRPSRATGAALSTLTAARPVQITPLPEGGVWMEAVIPASDGTWYGFYHNERLATACGDTGKVVPRIGAARSTDQGVTWTDLGILIEASPSTYQCDTNNTYFVGGVGDLSALLDASGQNVYIYFSQYGRMLRQQGIGVARFAWADRDAPRGKLTVWSDGVWLPSGRRRVAMAIFPTTRAWHDEDNAADAFWGPSLHWNSYLQEYVMLVNRAKDESFKQEGVHISFSPRLDDPGAWSDPVKVYNGGRWYPQIVGLDAVGTDRMAGQSARFFMFGRSDYIIRFEK